MVIKAEIRADKKQKIVSDCSDEIDLGDPDAYRNGLPLEWFEKIRRNDPLHWHESKYAQKGFWVISTYKDMEFVGKHTELFSSAERTVLLTDPEGDELARQRLFLINMDPPQHLKYRKIVNRAFTPQFIQTMEVRLNKIAQDIVETILDRNSCDFVVDVAAQMPLRVIGDLLGIKKEDNDFIAHNANIMIFSDEPDFVSPEVDGKVAAARLFAYGMKLYEQHKRSPNETITGKLASGSIDGEYLKVEEFCFFFLMLLIAGFETTKSIITNAMRLFIEHPGQFQLLKNNPALLNNAIEEIVRFDPPAFNFFRTAMSDVELNGKVIRKGQKVALFYHSINRDEALNPNPNDFRIDREVINHRSFGYGEHFCLGMHLAKAELRAIITQLTAHLDNPKIDGKFERMRSRFFNSHKHMPIKYQAII